MNINREFPTLIDLCFEKIHQIYTQDDNGNSITEEEVSALVGIIHNIPFSSFKNFKLVRLLENRSIALDLPSEQKDQIQNIWCRFIKGFCLRNNYNTDFEPKMLMTELELQNLLKPIAIKLIYLEIQLKRISPELDALRETQIPSKIKTLINSISFTINDHSEFYETSSREQLINKLSLIEKNTDEKQKGKLIDEFQAEINHISQNISKNLETQAFLYLSRCGNLLKTFKPIQDYLSPLVGTSLPSILLNQIFTTCTFLKEIDVYFTQNNWDAMHGLISKIPSFVTSLKWIVYYGRGLSDHQLRKITENCAVLEVANLSLGINISEETLKAFFRKFSNTLIELHLEGINLLKKSTFQNLEFSQLKHVHLQVNTFEDGAIDTLKAPHLKTLHLTFSQGNPVTQKLDQLKALNITCPYEHVDQILHNCLNIESLEIALNAYKYLSLDHLKIIFFKMPYLEKFTNAYDVKDDVLSSLAEEIKKAQTFSSQLKWIVLPEGIKKGGALSDALSQHQLNPEIVIREPIIYDI